MVQLESGLLSQNSAFLTKGTIIARASYMKNPSRKPKTPAKMDTTAVTCRKTPGNSTLTGKKSVKDSAADRLRRTYEGRKVLVTGHTGFKGSWLCIWLTELGADVVGYGLEPRTVHDNFVVSKVHKRIQGVYGDIRHYDHLKTVLHDYRPEVVFHLAAQPLLRESYENPKETYDTNIGGIVNVLECCRFSDSVKVILNITSDKCYENRNWVWGYRENDPMGGDEPYSSSKACSEIITGAYRDSFFNPGAVAAHGKSVSSARAGNVIGGGDWSKDRIVPDSIRSLLKTEPIRMRNPEAVRPWQHVLEPLGGYLLLAARMFEEPARYAGAWNFGPDRNSFISVRILVENILTCWGSGSCEVLPDNNGPHEAELLALDTAKSRLKLGWKSLIGLDEAVRLTVDWYKAHEANADMVRLCLKQIRKYMERMDGYC